MANSKNIYIAIAAILVIQVLIVFKFPAVFKTDTVKKQTNQSRVVRYIPIGDSYTIGLGVDEQYSWPNILTGHLMEKGIEIDLAANPAVSGYTVRDAIEYELPVIEELKPDFVTVFIGANDNFAQRPVAEFQNDLTELLDRLRLILDKPENVVLVTIPDYSKSPALNDGDNDELSYFIAEYNRAIKELAIKRGLKVADIFAVSQKMTENEDYIEDGLHPSSLGYAKWESIIYPVVLDLLKD
jgi:lysophospholipase L1-like esterase